MNYCKVTADLNNHIADLDARDAREEYVAGEAEELTKVMVGQIINNATLTNGFEIDCDIAAGEAVEEAWSDAGDNSLVRLILLASKSDNEVLKALAKPYAEAIENAVQGVCYAKVDAED